jgi:glycosyltransferase involved in cell wall biosynthesis
LKREIPEIFLLIVGDGPEMTELLTLAGSQKTDRIRFVGFVNPSKLKEFYAASDAFVLLSSGEGISSALLEACSSGLPMLVSDVGANRDIVRSGENGFVMPDVQVETLVERIVETKHRLRSLSENSRHIALEKLDWRIVVREYLNIYERMEN